MLISSEGIASWSWLVPLLGAGAMGVYITSPILRDDSIGSQDMQITHYDSMIGLMKDVSNGLLGWRVVSTPRILYICGRLHHYFGHGKFRDIYPGISVRQTLQGVEVPYFCHCGICTMLFCQSSVSVLVM